MKRQKQLLALLALVALTASQAVLACGTVASTGRVSWCGVNWCIYNKSCTITYTCADPDYMFPEFGLCTCGSSMQKCVTTPTSVPMFYWTDYYTCYLASCGGTCWNYSTSGPTPTYRTSTQNNCS